MGDASIAGLLLRLIVSMGVVIGLMLMAARVLRRNGAHFGIGGGRGQKKLPVSIQAIQPLTRGAQVAVVRAGGREFVLGVTDQQVTLLHSAIEPRDDLEQLERPTSRRNSGAEPLEEIPLTTARTADVTADDDSGNELVGHLSAWTDALDLLREKTVRR